MATFIKPKKRKRSEMSALERSQHEAVTKLIATLTKNHAEQKCNDFVWDCPACKYMVFLSLLRELKDLLEYT